MGPWALLLKPTNIIIMVLLVVAGITSGTAYVFFNKNIRLHEDLAASNREKELFVSVHNQQITHLAEVVERQNTAIEGFRTSGDLQVAEMGKVQTKVDAMRVTAERQLAELRKKPVINYTCEQSIQSLIEQTKLLQWGVVK